jgi:hypothetical protein
MLCLQAALKVAACSKEGPGFQEKSREQKYLINGHILKKELYGCSKSLLGLVCKTMLYIPDYTSELPAKLFNKTDV